MPKNRTIYVADEDAPIWNEAKRLVPFHERKSLSAYLTEHLASTWRTQSEEVLTSIARCSVPERGQEKDDEQTKPY
jgi:hypothetical protein